MEHTPSLSDLKTISEAVQAAPGILSEHTLRYQARNRDTNGLGDAFVKVGKKLLVNWPRYSALIVAGAGRDRA